MAFYEVTIALLHAPSNVSMQDTLLVHFEVVLLAVKCIKQTILSGSDVPLPLQPTVHTPCSLTITAYLALGMQVSM